MILIFKFLCFLLAIILSVVTCLFIKKYFKYLNIIDVPNKRSSHDSLYYLVEWVF